MWGEEIFQKPDRLSTRLPPSSKIEMSVVNPKERHSMTTRLLGGVGPGRRLDEGGEGAAGELVTFGEVYGSADFPVET